MLLPLLYCSGRSSSPVAAAFVNRVSVNFDYDNRVMAEVPARLLQAAYTVCQLEGKGPRARMPDPQYTGGSPLCQAAQAETGDMATAGASENGCRGAGHRHQLYPHLGRGQRGQAIAVRGCVHIGETGVGVVGPQPAGEARQAGFGVCRAAGRRPPSSYSRRAQSCRPPRP